MNFVSCALNHRPNEERGGFSITLKRKQRAKINIILALCQQSAGLHGSSFFSFNVHILSSCLIV
ncbi:hypothetical protein FJP11_18600 [Bacillus altitudinis]|nr:hypothetical protein [Bacillus altitudinis]